MDYQKAVLHLSASAPTQQLACLLAVSPNLAEYTPTEDFYSALVQNGLSAENDLVREVSFRCLHVLLRQQPSRWGDVKTAIITELSTAAKPKPLRAALAIFHVIPKRELLLFFGSKEGIASTLSCCTAENLDVRTACVTALAPLLVDLWMLIDGPLDPEGLIQTESTADGKRFVLDFKDACLSLFRQFTSGLLGKSELAGSLGGGGGDDLQHTGCLSAYFSAIGHLLTRFNAASSEVDRWVNALTGGGPVLSMTTSRRADAVAAASLYPLIKAVIPRLCSDPYLLISNWEKVYTSSDMASGGVTSSTTALAATVCMNGLFVAMVHSLPRTTSADVKLVTGLPAVMEFDAVSHSARDAVAAESASSRHGNIGYLNAVSIIEEWLTVHLSAVLQSPFPDVVVAAIQASLELSQHPALAYARYQICPVVCTNGIRTIASHSAVPSSSLAAVTNAIGFMGWFHPQSRNVTACDPCTGSADFSNLYDLYMQHQGSGSVPMFLEDETYCSGIDAPLPALSNGSRGSHFLSMSKLMTAGDALLPNLCSVGGSLNGGSRSLFMPISSPVGIICAYCLFACRFAPRLMTGEGSAASFLVSLTGFMSLSTLGPTSEFPSLHVLQARLVAELAMLVLTDPAKLGENSPVEFIKAFLNAPIVTSLFSDPTSELRQILSTAVCRAYVRLLPAALVTVISVYESATGNSSCRLVSGSGRWSISSGHSGPAVLQIPSDNPGEASKQSQAEILKAEAKFNFNNVIQTGFLLLSVLSPCLSWPVAHSSAGDGAAVQYLCVLFEISRALRSPIDGSTSIPADVLTSVKKWSGEMLAERYESLLFLLNSEDICSKTVRSQLCIILAQFLTLQYGTGSPMVVEKGLEVLDAIKKDLFQYEEKEYVRKKIMQSALIKGRLGMTNACDGVSSEMNKADCANEYHPSGNSCRQLQAVLALEFLALHNRAMMPAVLDTLRDFHQRFNVQSLSPVLRTTPYYYHMKSEAKKGNDNLFEDITLRGQMAGWSVASASVVQRSYLALNRILAQAPSLPGGVKEIEKDKQSEHRHVSTMSRGVTSDMMDVFTTTAYDSSSVFLSDTFDSSLDKRNFDYTTGKTMSELEKKLSAHGVTLMSPSRAMFRWLGGIGSSPVCADVGIECSFFHSWSRKETLEVLGVKSHGCVADVISLLDDVLNGHLLSTRSAALGCPQSGRENFAVNNYLSEVLFASADIVEYSTTINAGLNGAPRGKTTPWIVLSGSSDVLTVLGCFSVNRLNRQGIIKCMIINSSGFKIPNFSVQPVLSTPMPDDSQVHFSSAVNFTVNQSGLQDGCEYMMPGAVVERSWECVFHHCYSVTLIAFRVVYTNLVAENDSVEDPCFDLFSCAFHEQKKTNESTGGEVVRPTSLHRHNSSLGAIMDSKTKNCKHIYSQPLIVRPMDMLLPYGCGTLDAMSSLSISGSLGSHERDTFGIPFSVYRSMRTRMSVALLTHIITFKVFIPEGVSFYQAVNDALKCVENNPAETTSYISVRARVSMPCQTCSSDWGGQFSALLAWCFQSSFGDEVCMTLTASRSAGHNIIKATSPSDLWTGSLDIRSSSDDLANALIVNSIGTLCCILGDLPVSLVTNPPRIASASVSVPILASHLDQQQKEAEHRKLVTEQTILLREVKEREAKAKETAGRNTSSSTNAFNSDPFLVDPFGFSAPAPSDATKNVFSDDIFAAFDTIPVAQAPSSAPQLGRFADDILGLFSGPPAAPSAGGSAAFLPNFNSSLSGNSMGLLGLSAMSTSIPTDNASTHLKLPKRAKHLHDISNAMSKKTDSNLLALSMMNETAAMRGSGDKSEYRETKYTEIRTTTWKSGSGC